MPKDKTVDCLPYATFKERLLAGLIDFAIFIPVGIICSGILIFSPKLYLLILFPYAFSFAIYQIYFHAKWGATLGKMAMKIKVVNHQYQDIERIQAVYRHSVDLVLALIIAVLSAYTIIQLSDMIYFAFNPESRLDYFHKQVPDLYHKMNLLSVLWFASEFVVMLLNEKRKSIHDYIADTIVVSMKG